MLSIKAAVTAHAARSNRVWDEERSQTVGASEIGQCARRVWFAKFASDEGVPQDGDYADRWGAKVRGTVYENEWWVPALRAQYGDSLLFAGEDQRTLFQGFLSATPDGLIEGLPPDALAGHGIAHLDGTSVAVECKSVDPRTKIDGPKPEHRLQVIVQLGLIRARTPHQPMWGLISYTDTSFWDEVKEFPIRFDEGIFTHALDRAAAIMTAARAFDLRPEGAITGGKECQYCPFTHACGQTQARAAEKANGKTVTDDEAAPLIAKARASKAHDAAAKREAAAAKTLEEEIKTELSRLGARTVRHGRSSVAWSPVKGRLSTDHKALRKAAEAAGIDAARFTSVGAPSDRLTITINEESESK